MPKSAQQRTTIQEVWDVMLPADSVEFFEHLSFGDEMFRWSLYSLAGFGSVGLFLLIAGMIPSLRQGMRKRFFF